MLWFHGEMLEQIRLLTKECWASAYGEYLATIGVDQKTGFSAKLFQKLVIAHKIQVQWLETQLNKSIEGDKTGNEPLRCVFQALQHQVLGIDPEITLRHAKKIG